jgi:hypothetical protein
MVVVTSSPENVRSSWVTAEWGLFVNEKRSARKTGNLITVIIGDMRIADLPPTLRYYEVIPDGPGAFEKVLNYVSREQATARYLLETDSRNASRVDQV